MRLDRNVESGDHLIADDKARFYSERSGYANSLPLPTGKFMRITVGVLRRQIHHLEQFFHPLGYFIRRDNLMLPQHFADGFTDFLYDQDSDWDVVVAVAEIAKERELPPAQIALAWMLAKPFVTAPIIGATKLGHLEDAISALDVVLSEQEIARLELPYAPHPVKGMRTAALYRPARLSRS